MEDEKHADEDLVTSLINVDPHYRKQLCAVFLEMLEIAQEGGIAALQRPVEFLDKRKKLQKYHVHVSMIPVPRDVKTTNTAVGTEEVVSANTGTSPVPQQIEPPTIQYVVTPPVPPHTSNVSVQTIDLEESKQQQASGPSIVLEGGGEELEFDVNDSYIPQQPAGARKIPPSRSMYSNYSTKLDPIDPELIETVVRNVAVCASTAALPITDYQYTNSIEWCALGNRLPDLTSGVNVLCADIVDGLGGEPLIGSEPLIEYTKEECYHRAIECDITNDEAWLRLGECVKELAKPPTSYSPAYCFEQAVRYNPLNALAWYRLGTTMRTTASKELFGKEYHWKDCILRAVEIDSRITLGWEVLLKTLDVDGFVTVGGEQYHPIDVLSKIVESGSSDLKLQGRGMNTKADDLCISATTLCSRWIALGNALVAQRETKGSNGGVLTINGRGYDAVKCYLAAAELETVEAVLAWRLAASTLLTMENCQVTLPNGVSIDAVDAIERALELNASSHHNWEIALNCVEKMNRSINVKGKTYSKWKCRVALAGAIGQKASLLFKSYRTCKDGDAPDQTKVECLVEAIELSYPLIAEWINITMECTIDSNPEAYEDYLRFLGLSSLWSYNVSLAINDLQMLCYDTVVLNGVTYTRDELKDLSQEVYAQGATPWIFLAEMTVHGGMFTLAGKIYTKVECCIEAVKRDHGHILAWCDLAMCLGKERTIEIDGNVFDSVTCAVSALLGNWKTFLNTLKWVPMETRLNDADPSTAVKLAYAHCWFVLGSNLVLKNYKSIHIAGIAGIKDAEVFAESTPDDVYTPRWCFEKCLSLDFEHTNAWIMLGHIVGKEREPAVINGKRYTQQDCYAYGLNVELLSTEGLLAVGEFLAPYQYATIQGQQLSSVECLVTGLYGNHDHSSVWLALGNRLREIEIPIADTSMTSLSLLSAGNAGITLNANLCFHYALQYTRDGVVTEAVAALVNNHRGNDDDMLSTEARDNILMKTLEQNVRSATMWVALARQCGDDATVVVLGGKYTKLTLLRQALICDPAHADAWYQLGMYLGGKTLFEGSLTSVHCFLTALECNPKFSNAWEALGMFLPHWGHVSVGGMEYREVDCYAKAVSYDPASSTAWFRLGMMIQRGARVSMVGSPLDAHTCFTYAMRPVLKLPGMIEVSGGATQYLTEPSNGTSKNQSVTIPTTSTQKTTAPASDTSKEKPSKQPQPQQQQQKTVPSAPPTTKSPQTQPSQANKTESKPTSNQQPQPKKSQQQQPASPSEKQTDKQKNQTVTPPDKVVWNMNSSFSDFSMTLMTMAFVPEFVHRDGKMASTDFIDYLLAHVQYYNQESVILQVCSAVHHVASCCLSKASVFCHPPLIETIAKAVKKLKPQEETVVDSVLRMFTTLLSVDGRAHMAKFATPTVRDALVVLCYHPSQSQPCYEMLCTMMGGISEMLPETKDMYATSAVRDALVHMLNSSVNPELILTLCMTLCFIVGSNEGAADVRRDVFSSDTMRQALVKVSHHIASNDGVNWLCTAVRRIIAGQGNIDKRKDAFAVADFRDAIVRMSTKVSNAECVLTVSAVLVTLCSGRGKSLFNRISTFAVAKVRDSLVVMVKHATTPDSVKTILEAFRNLTQGNDTEAETRKDVFGTSTVRDSLLSLSKFTVLPDIVHMITSVIANITEGDNEMRKCVFQQVGVRDALVFMGKYATTFESAESLMYAVRSILFLNADVESSEEHKALFCTPAIRDMLISIALSSAKPPYTTFHVFLDIVYFFLEGEQEHAEPRRDLFFIPLMRDALVSVLNNTEDPELMKIALEVMVKLLNDSGGSADRRIDMFATIPLKNCLIRLMHYTPKVPQKQSPLVILRIAHVINLLVGSGGNMNARLDMIATQEFHQALYTMSQQVTDEECVMNVIYASFAVMGGGGDNVFVRKRLFAVTCMEMVFRMHPLISSRKALTFIVETLRQGIEETRIVLSPTDHQDMLKGTQLQSTILSLANRANCPYDVRQVCQLILYVLAVIDDYTVLVTIEVHNAIVHMAQFATDLESMFRLTAIIHNLVHEFGKDDDVCDMFATPAVMKGMCTMASHVSSVIQANYIIKLVIEIIAASTQEVDARSTARRNTFCTPEFRDAVLSMCKFASSDNDSVELFFILFSLLTEDPSGRRNDIFATTAFRDAFVVLSVHAQAESTVQWAMHALRCFLSGEGNRQLRIQLMTGDEGRNALRAMARYGSVPIELLDPGSTSKDASQKK
eukprot:PhF_6_TR44157/c0_g1_i1/m.67593